MSWPEEMTSLALNKAIQDKRPHGKCLTFIVGHYQAIMLCDQFKELRDDGLVSPAVYTRSFVLEIAGSNPTLASFSHCESACGRSVTGSRFCQGCAGFTPNLGPILGGFSVVVVRPLAVLKFRSLYCKIDYPAVRIWE